MNSDLARELRRNSTEAEKHLWSRLRNRQLGGCTFRRQAPAGGYVADFLCEAAKLIVELDGGQHAERTDKNAKRTRILEQHGYRVVRFWNNEVMESLEGALERLVEILEDSPKSP